MLAGTWRSRANNEPARHHKIRAARAVGKCVDCIAEHSVAFAFLSPKMHEGISLQLGVSKAKLHSTSDGTLDSTCIHPYGDRLIPCRRQHSACPGLHRQILCQNAFALHHYS